MSIETIRKDSIVIGPTAPHTHTIVFLHGRGDTADNFSQSLHLSRDSHRRTLYQALPSVRWVFPQAPTRQCASSPNVWPQWFDVWDVTNFASREELQAVGLKEVVPEIRRVLADEAARLGGKWNRVILVGISMGAATAVHALFNLDVPGPRTAGLAAFVGFSCRCPFAGRSLAEMRKTLGLEDVPGHNNVLRNTPVLLEHCENDPLVLVQDGRKMRDTLSAFGANVVWKEYADGGHWFNTPDGMNDAVAFLSRVMLDPPNEDPNAMDLS